MKLFSPQTYQDRRNGLKSQLSGGVVFLVGNDESSINFKDNWYHYRQDSTFLYYFGISVPGLHAMIDLDSGEEVIFGDDLTIDHIVWTGPQPKVAELASKVGVENTYPISEITKKIAGRKVHYLPPYRGEHTVLLSGLLGQSNEQIASGYSVDLIKAVVAQRSIKSAEEIVEINMAADITSKMHLAVMQAARPGMKEHELVAIAEKVARDNNVALSFPPIVTINGQTLHNHYYGNTINEGDMVLCDGGTESEMFYAGDMTRTFPVDKTFDPRQKDLYDIVYSAHSAAIAALRPGVRYKDIHILACTKLAEGLIDVGLMTGNADEAVAAGAHTMFFQCGLGHMMGYDVHDMENLGEQYVGYTPDLIKSTEFGLKSLRLGKELEPGFVLTVEPGIYIIPELIDLNKSAGNFKSFINYSKLEKFRDFGGIRVEDDYVITEGGADLLGTPLAGTSDEIEEVRTNALS